MENIMILSEEKVITLKTNLKQVQQLMLTTENGNEWLRSFFKDDKPFLKSKYTFEDFELDMSKENPIETDCENAKRLYTHLKDIPNSVLSDERLWIGLAFGKFYDYMEYRWNSNKSTNIKSRWLFDHGQKRGLFFNGLARLFWFAKYSYDASLSNPFELTEYCFKYNDILVQMVYRSYSNSSLVRMSIIKAHKRFIEDGGSINVEIYKNTLKYVSFLGGAYLLDSFTEEELTEKIYNYLLKFFCDEPGEQLHSLGENQETKNTLSMGAYSIDDEEETVEDPSFIADLQNISSLSSTKPVSLSYKGQEPIPVTSWIETYIATLKILQLEYSSEFVNLAEDSSFIYFSANEERFSTPIMISNGVFIESSRSDIYLIKGLKATMDSCGISYNSIEIKVIKERKKNTNNIIKKLNVSEFKTTETIIKNNESTKENSKKDNTEVNHNKKTIFHLEDSEVIPKDRFVESIFKLSMSYSYKPVLLKAIFKYGNANGKINIDKVVSFFKAYYESRRKSNLIVENRNSMFARGNYSDDAVKRLIIANPLKSFERAEVLCYNKKTSIISVNPSIWSNLTKDEIINLTAICDQKLEDYYKRFVV